MPAEIALHLNCGQNYQTWTACGEKAPTKTGNKSWKLSLELELEACSTAGTWRLVALYLLSCSEDRAVPCRSCRRSRGVSPFRGLTRVGVNFNVCAERCAVTAWTSTTTLHPSAPRLKMVSFPMFGSFTMLQFWQIAFSKCKFWRTLLPPFPEVFTHARGREMHSPCALLHYAFSIVLLVIFSGLTNIFSLLQCCFSVSVVLNENCRGQHKPVRQNTEYSRSGEVNTFVTQIKTNLDVCVSKINKAMTTPYLTKIVNCQSTSVRGVPQCT